MARSKNLRINLYTEKEVFVWCRLFWSPKDDLDVEIMVPDHSTNHSEPETIEPGQPQLGGPGWYDYDIVEHGLYELIRPETSLGVDFDAWAQWGLHNGIAPMQPFLLHIPRPHYYQDYEGEWDADYDWDIHRIEPLTHETALKRWNRYFKSFKYKIPEVKHG